jgi:hypothetical protein
VINSINLCYGYVFATFQCTAADDDPGFQQVPVTDGYLSGNKMHVTLRTTRLLNTCNNPVRTDSREKMIHVGFTTY